MKKRDKRKREHGTHPETARRRKARSERWRKALAPEPEREDKP